MKRVVIGIVFMLLILPIVSSVEFDMKDEFKQGETLTARVSGNFIEAPLKENIFLYRGHVRVGFDPYIAKIDDEYYIYGSLLSKLPNNYSLRLENVKYMQGAQVSEEDLIKNFTIINETADFSVDKGFIITNKNFYIEVQNLLDNKITISISINSQTGGGFFASLFGGSEISENSVELKSGEIEKIEFELNDITEPTLETIQLSSDNLDYEIPVYVYVNKTEPEELEKDFRFEPSEFNVSMSTNSNSTRVVYLTNTGDLDLENISVSVSDSLKPYLYPSVEKIAELGSNSSIKIDLNFYSDNDENSYEGQVTAKMLNGEEFLYAYCGVFLNFIEDYIPTEEENETGIEEDTIKTCSELSGVICSSEETCDGNIVSARDDRCCLGTCNQEEKSSTGKYIAIGIILVIIIFLMWFYKKKFKGTKKRKVDLLKIGVGRREK